MHYIFIFHSQNELNLQNVKDECLKQQWVSVASYENQNTSKIIYFNIESTAKDFIRRNFNKNDMIGLISVPENQFLIIKEKHPVEHFSFPRKIQNLNIEIIELQTEIELQVNYRKII
jgi:hypothetical protein